MYTKKYSNLSKPLIWRESPEGLFKGNLFWMEGSSDLEGFQGSFAFQYIKEPGVILPQEGALIHSFDTVYAFVALDTADILDLGADVSVELGEEREKYTFNQAQLVCIPKGTQYGNIRVESFRHSFAVLAIYLAPSYSAINIPESELLDPVPGDKYKDHVKIYAWEIDPNTGYTKHSGGAIKDESGMGYTKALDERGVMHSRMKMGPEGMGPGNADSLLWVFGDYMQGFELNTLWGHYSHPGKWHRGGEHHTHPEEEVLVTLGLDADDPLNTGAEIEISMGEEDERHFANTPNVWICPKGFQHLPQITRWVDRPYAFFVINLDGSHLSPWKDKEGEHQETEE